MGCSPPTVFGHLDRPVTALQLCRLQFSHKKFVAEFFPETYTF